jgi:p-cumic alcohol dehydrogenase
MTFDGKIALVTGAATGIGAAIATGLAAAGAHVVGADLDWKDQDSASGIEHVRCDVADPSSVEACVADVVARHGGVDILVNNAALATDITLQPFEQIAPEDWTRVLTVNTLSQFLCSKAVIPHMRERSRGGSSI